MKQTPSLEFNSALPLYYQLKELLKKQIQDKTWQPEAMIPPESELSSMYDVSVGTVKKALSEMVKEGLLYRKQGKGTFVCRSSLDKSLFWCIKKTCDMQGHSLRLISNITETKKEKPNPEIQTALKMDKETDCYIISGSRLYGDSAVVSEKLYVPENFFPEFETHDLSEAVVSEILEVDFHYPFLRAEEAVRIVQPSPEIRETLGLKKTGSAIELTRISYSYDDTPIEYRVFWGDAESFEFKQTIK